MKTSLGPRTLVYPHPVFLVGTYDAKDQPNIMAAAWSGICCSRPPCVAVSLRKATYSHGNIVLQKCFTLNIPSVALAKEADYVGIYSGRDENKFESTGLTPEKSTLVHAPYVKECPVVLECKLAHTFELGLHTQFVGEILDVKADETILGENGLPDIQKVMPLIYSSSDKGYYGVGKRVADAFLVGKTK
ncbi:MAG: flavin reductase family protein [Pseudomonadota bacterium]